MSVAVRAACFDASALVKLYVNESGSDPLRQYWRVQATKYTTPFCFYETLSILKGKHRRGVLTEDQYFRATSDMVAWFRASASRVDDIVFTDRDVFRDAREMAQEYHLDLSDAFQLLTLQAGFFAGLIGGSQTILVTADEPLAKAARTLRLPVWDCMREPVPPQ
jgi:predicted nucleic acid-binding protein